MECLTLLRRAEAAGLRLHLDGDVLQVQGPKEAVSIVAELRAHKPAIISAWWPWQAERLLRQVDDLDLRQDLRDAFDERFAIALADSDDEPSAAMLAMGEVLFAMLERGLLVRCSVAKDRLPTSPTAASVDTRPILEGDNV